MSRRTIEDSDDEAPTDKGNTNNLGPYAPHLSNKDGKWTLENHDELIQLLPVGANGRPTSYQMLAIVSALCASSKKARMALFRQSKAGVVFGDWWDYCLSHLSSSNGGDGELILVELLKFTKVLADVIKKKADLTKAKERMGVDFVSQLEATKKALDNVPGATEVKARFTLVQKHFLDLYEVQIGSYSATSAAQADKSAQSAIVKPATNSTPTTEDRNNAAAQKRIDAMKKSQMKRAGVTSSPTKPPVAAQDLSSNAAGSSCSAVAAAAAKNDIGSESSRKIENSYGSSRPSEASAKNPGKPTSLTSTAWADSSTEGWGRHSTEETERRSTGTAKVTFLCNYNDTRPWGPLNQTHPYKPSQESQPNRQPSRQQDNRDTSHPSSNDRYRDSARDSRLNDSRNSDHSSSYSSRDYRSNDSSRQQNQGLANSSRNDRYDPQPNRQSSSYGSREYGSKDSAHRSGYSSRQPYSGRNDSSDHEPYSKGGNIRNNQPGGQYAPRRDDTSYRGSDMPQQSNQNDSRRDQYDMNYSRRSSHDYDRRDSRASSYQSGSSDRRYDDRYDDRKDSTERPIRSGSPPRDDRHSRRLEGDRRDNNDRYDDRKRHDRDDSFRRSDSRGDDSKICKYFFTERGCRNGANCRFSHDDGGDRKTSTERVFEDNGSEDGEVRPAKRFKGPDTSSAQKPFTFQPPATAGRGMGRGAHVNKPAWMTKTENAPDPTGAPVANSTKQATYASLSNADLASVLSSVTGNSTSIPSAGRGRGRGNVDNRPAWMTKTEKTKAGPSGVSVPPVANGMNGRFAPPPSAKNNIPPQPAMGRGRGRGTDNRPAWMTRGEN